MYIVAVAACVLLCIGCIVDTLHLYFSPAVLLLLVVPTSATFVWPQETSFSVDDEVPPCIIPMQSRAAGANSFLFDCGSKNA